MENVSKALIISGSVLISIIILSSLFLIFNKLSIFENEKSNNEEIIQKIEWNKKLESYNRDNIYGSDIISIANFMQDNNLKNDGYEELDLEIILTNSIENAKIFKTGRYNLFRDFICNKKCRRRRGIYKI